MIQWHPLAQAARFQRTAWINTFSACSAMQLKGKEMLETSLNQCFWLTEKDKQEYLTWTESCLEATEKMQSLIDRSFQEVEKHLSDQPAAPASAPKKSSIASLVLAATQPAPKAAAPARKKAPSKRSTTASKSTGGAQVKKETVTAKSEPAANKKVASPAKKRRAATTKTAKKPATAAKTGASTKQTSTLTAKSAASDNAAGKEKVAEKQTPAKTKYNSGSVPKQTP